jgi:hypothetical protein
MGRDADGVHVRGGDDPVSDVVAYHPGTQAQVQVPEESMPHLRASGWLLLGEHLANQAQAAEREQQAAKADSKTAVKEK